MNAGFSAFADNSSVVVLDGMTIENGEASIDLFGELVIRRDRASLQVIQYLIGVLHDIEREIAASELDSPVSAGAASVDDVQNPFL